MLTIQDAGKQILRHNPGKFYVFAGVEYGIKSKYISELISTYGEYIEANSVSSIIDLMRTKHLVPLKPKLYIVRYDEDFISKLNAKSSDEIANCKIIGTIVCIYESTKHQNKCDKYLSEYTVVFEKVNNHFLKNYLVKDFPNLPTEYIDYVLSFKDDYMGAWNICNSLSNLRSRRCSDLELYSTFKSVSTATDIKFRKFFASKHYGGCKYIIDNYPGQLDTLFYTILNTLIELDKITDSKYGESDIRGYEDLWTKSDIFYMFLHTYEEIKRSRKYSTYSTANGLLYIVSLLLFSSVPTLEALS